jgi:hypothetical protein
MKKYLLTILVLITFMVAQDAFASGYLLGTVGSGGEIDDTSYGGEIGAVWPQEAPQFLLGLGFS